MAIIDTIHIRYSLAVLDDGRPSKSSGTIEVPSWMSADLRTAVAFYFFGYAALDLVTSAEQVDAPDEEDWELSISDPDAAWQHEDDD